MRIHFLVLVLLINISTYAQNLSYGFEQHVGLSSFTRGLLPFNPMLSSSTGFVIDKPLSELTVLQSGLYIHLSGASNDIYWPKNNQYVRVNEVLQLTYLRIPMIFKVVVGEKRNFLLGAGGYFNLFLDRHINSDNADFPISNGPWLSLELDQQDFGIILRQELVRGFVSTSFSMVCKKSLVLILLLLKRYHMGSIYMVESD